MSNSNNQKTEEEFHDNSRRYKKIFDTIPKSLMVVEPFTGKIIETNLYHQKNFLDQDTQVQNKTIFNDPLIHALGIEEEIQKALSGDEIELKNISTSIPEKMLLPDDTLTDSSKLRLGELSKSSRIFNFSSKHIQSSDDKLFQIVLIITEITSEYLIEKYLMQNANLLSLGRLARSTAHQIINPLQGILFAADVLLVDTANETQKQLLTAIVKESHRIEKVIRDLQRFAKDEEQSKTETTIDEILDSVILLIEPVCMKNKISLSIEVMPYLPKIIVAVPQIQEGIFEILENSIHALRLKKIERKLSINVESGFEKLINSDKLEKVIKIVIWDNGIGIQPEHIEKVFDLFFTTNWDKNSVGKGLAIASKTIRDNNGEIKVVTEFGKYSQFTITFPINIENIDL